MGTLIRQAGGRAADVVGDGTRLWNRCWSGVISEPKIGTFALSSDSHSSRLFPAFLGPNSALTTAFDRIRATTRPQC